MQSQFTTNIAKTILIVLGQDARRISVDNILLGEAECYAFPLQVIEKDRKTLHGLLLPRRMAYICPHQKYRYKNSLVKSGGAPKST